MEPSYELVKANQQLAQDRLRDNVNAPLSTDDNQGQGDPLAWIDELASEHCSQSQEHDIDNPSPIGGNGQRHVSTIDCDVRVYPDLPLALINGNLATVALLYQIFRANDINGSGKFNLDRMRSLLTDKSTPWGVYKKRNLRGILRRGDGIAWNIDGGNVYLRSPDKIINTLGGERMRCRPVMLPIKAALLSGIQVFKAHMLQAWHAGQRENNPISQRAIRQATGISERSQYRYNGIANTKRKFNLAIGGVKTKQSYQDAAWNDHGRNLMTFTDHIGKRGPAGKHYISWRLPDSYSAPIEQATVGRLKKINRQIDLVIKPQQGNGYDVNQIYYQDSGAATLAAAEQRDNTIYWYDATTLTRTATNSSKLKGVDTWSVAHA